MSTQIKKYTTKAGKTLYYFNAYLGVDDLGKKRYAKRQGFTTKRHAQIALADLYRDVEENGLNTHSMRIRTFEDLYKQWLKQYRLTVKKSSVANKKNITEKNILKYFGKMELSKVTVAYCQSVVNEWYENYKSYSYFRATTSQILKYGVTMEIIKSNPMAKTIVPRKKEEDKKLKYYTKEQLEHFFECLKDYGEYKRFTFFRLLAFSGARKSEILALQWKDVDLFNKSITINKTIAKDENGNVIVQTAKTSSSKRIISLDDETIRVLREWHTRQKKDYLKMGFNTSSTEQLVFTTMKSNQVLEPNIPNGWLKSIIKVYKLPVISPHHFRHTHASLLLQAGVPIKEVSERLGHKDVGVTLSIYSHVMPEEAEKTAEKFANFVGF